MVRVAAPTVGAFDLLEVATMWRGARRSGLMDRTVMTPGNPARTLIPSGLAPPWPAAARFGWQTGGSKATSPT